MLTAIDAVLTGTFETPEAMAAEVAKVREQIAAMIAEAAAEGATAEEISAAAEGAAKAMAKLTQAENLISAKRQVADMHARRGAVEADIGGQAAGQRLFVEARKVRALMNEPARHERAQEFGSRRKAVCHGAG